jgi:hypothetical protein
MVRLAVIICTVLVLLGWEVRAQVGSPEDMLNALKRSARTGTRVSASRQFTIQDVPKDSPPPLVLPGLFRSNYLQLNADVLAFSCDNVKKAVLAELGATDGWHDRVSIFLHRARSLDELITVGLPASGPDWLYFLDVPDTVDYNRLCSTLVNIVLLEVANRGAQRSADIPAWLGQGLTREIMLSSPFPLILTVPQATNSPVRTLYLDVDGRRQDPLRLAYEALQTHPPLTLEELSWPVNGQDETDAYRGSAQLFVHELLKLPDGRACMRSMIQLLARHYNWQTSFLYAFQEHFKSQLDLEKWWALKIVAFTGRDLASTWTSEESWRKLDLVVVTPVEVRSASDEMPLRSEVSLQTIVREWDMAQQFRVFEDKSQQMFMLRPSVSQDLALLVDDYRQVFADYLRKREKDGFKKTSKLRLTPGLDDTAKEMVLRLDRLEARRAEARPVTQSARTVADGSAVNH